MDASREAGVAGWVRSHPWVRTRPAFADLAVARASCVTG